MVNENARYRSVAQIPQETPPTPNDRPVGPTASPETRDSLRSTLCRLAVIDRQLLLMYYADGLTLREIGCVLGISETTASLRHKALIAKLRQMARTSVTQQEGSLSW